jgi:hypothetical protein
LRGCSCSKENEKSQNGGEHFHDESPELESVEGAETFTLE